MTRTMTLLYEVYDGLYVNLTNRCSCRCTFCLRSQGESVCEIGRASCRERVSSPV